jgi:hypothetical protein
MALKQNDRYDILTPTGWSKFSGIQTVERTTGLKLVLASGTVIECTTDHQFKTPSGWKLASALTSRCSLITKDGKIRIREVIPILDARVYYDILDTHKHAYYSNDIISHNCDFLGSSATLISAQKLRTLVFTEPIVKTAVGVEVFTKPIGPTISLDEKGKAVTIPAHIYALVADVSHGVGMDNSAFSVIDITEAPFRQVAKYMNNEIAPSAYPDVIATTAKYYNNAYVLCESNDIGMQILNDLQLELEVENILGTSLTKRGQRLSSGSTTKHRLGVKTSTAVKRIGCAALKDLIEHDQLLVNDYTTIEELSTFVRHLNSFQAEEGCHDDMVMGLVLFGWLSSQTVFKELTNTNMRARMAADRLSQLEDDMRPDPILIMDGQSGLVDPMDLELGFNDYHVTTVW